MKIRNIEKAHVICLSSIISQHLPEIVPDTGHQTHRDDGDHPDPRPAAAGRPGRPGRRPPRLLRLMGGVQAELRQAVRQRRGGGETVRAVNEIFISTVFQFKDIVDFFLHFVDSSEH